MIALGAALLAAYGVHLLFTSVAFGWNGVAPGPRPIGSHRRRRRTRDWLVQAGLVGVRPAEFLTVMVVLFAVGGALGYAVFGGALAALGVGGFAASFPPASYRARRRGRQARALEAWPRMIEEIRIHTTSLGRSIPQALFDVGRRGPIELRPAFDAAHREWLLSTDFTRTLQVLKAQLADPTADAACETLLVAHQIGGVDLDRRLEALAEDRIQDTQGRKDGRAKQAGVRFARRFVLIVPLGMAVAGMSVGDGRQAYQSSGGQLAVVTGLAMVAVCWAWAGRIMRIPDEQRVFPE